jgi:hypothetical protein
MLDRGVERALSLAARGAAVRARARQSLSVLLEWSRSSRAPWRSSRLTMPGSPIEFAFSSCDHALRYCVEVADPRDLTTYRLHQACAALDRLSAPCIDRVVLKQMERLQAGGTLGWGAWVGGRHSERADRYKLYVEVPRERADEAHRWSETIVGAHALPRSQGCHVGLIGYDLHAGRVEFYYRAKDLLPTTVPLLLDRAQMQARTSEVMDLLWRLYRFSRADRLPARDVGFSYSISLDGGPVTFSMYFFCLSLFGGDGNARNRVLRLAATNNWQLPAYEAFSEPLAAAKGVPTRHGLLGVVLRPDEAPAITVGIAPTDGLPDAA